MGNCTLCIQSQQTSTNRINLLSSTSSYEDIRRTLHRNRLTNFRTVPSYNLHGLIDETLLIIRTVVDTDQEPPHAMLVLSRIANREDRWLDVIIALVERVPINDPLGATVSALLIDECSLPSKELLQQLIKRLCSNNRIKIKQLQMIIDEYIQEINKDSNDLQTDHHINEEEKTLQTSEKSLKRSTITTTTKPGNISDDNLNQERNTLVILGCLAEKLVGPSSASMLETIALEYLIDRVYLGIYGYNQLKSSDIISNTYSSILKIILFALIALEKFAQTSESKHILLQSLTIDNEQRKMNVLEYYESWITSNNCLKKQIGFYAQWLLDNVFILSYRRPSYETIDHQLINVILNDKDVSEYLKIGSDGLEARNDTVSFESVRCTFHVNSGAWYYEVLILTEGVMQIGWATKQSKFLNQEGYGIGDDQYSIAYDGCRNLIWYGAKSIPHTNQPWKSGDILGCLIDLDVREVIFSLNGRCLEPFRKLFSHTSANENYFAAASFMSYQHCRFNFGSIPFSYPPKRKQTFQIFNQHAYLADKDKFILPKYKKLELLRTMTINEQDCILCVDQQACIQLRPCQHTGFCQECAHKLDICPICRSSIKERYVIAN